MQGKTETCKGGQSFGNQSKSCAPGSQGMLCAACSVGYVREKVQKPCTLCTSLPRSEHLVFKIIGDCLGKAAFALYATNRYMYAVVHVGKLDSVLTRVFIQFTTVSAVIKEIDFSSLPLYAWQVNPEQQLKGERSMLEYPAWFDKYMNQLLGFSGSVPSMSVGEGLECLIIRWGPKDHRKNLLYKRVLPCVFWLVYPIIILCWTLFLALVLAKVGWPILQRIRQRRREKFIALLIQAGVTQKNS